MSQLVSNYKTSVKYYRPQQPLYLIMVILIYEGFANIMSITDLPIIQSRPLTWGVVITFFLMVYNSKNFIIPSIFRISLFIIIKIIFVWTIIGLYNSNTMTIVDCRAIIVFLSAIIVAYSSIHNDKQALFIQQWLTKALFPIAVLFIVSRFTPLYIDLYRYEWIFIFPYCYSLTKILSKNIILNSKDYLFFLVFLISVLILFTKAIMFCVVFSTGTILLLIKPSIKKILKFSILIAGFVLLIILYNESTGGDFFEPYRDKIFIRVLKIGNTDIMALPISQVLESIMENDQLGLFVDQALSGGRLSLWKLSFETFKNNMIFGSGLGFYFEGLQIHNGYIYLIVCFGLLGTVLFTYALMPIVYTIIAGFKKGDNLRLKVCFVGVVVAGLAYNLVGVILSHYAFLIIWGISIGSLLKLSFLDISKSKCNNQYL